MGFFLYIMAISDSGLRIQDRTDHKKSSEDPCQKAPSRVSKNNNK